MSYTRLTMIINGAKRSFVCDPTDTLADVLRRIGLTGTKIGCGIGVCGACSVLVNDKLVRACTKKIGSIPPYSSILTIEGIGTALNLHPLQKAWIAYGGVQCGFCTPGFIMSAYALLQENDNPTRAEVRAWFQKNRNACRCTGYKPIVDAVMAAAAVMRGEADASELDFKMPDDKRIYNSKYPRPNALSKVLGAADYGDDLSLKVEGMLHAAPVLARVHHANIISIDTSKAEKAEGVVKVVTAKDIRGINRITLPLGHPSAKGNGFERPIINDTKIFRYGDIPAVVVADTRAHARAAAKLVKIEYEELPAYLRGIETLSDDFVGIHPGYPAIIEEAPLIFGDDPRPIIEKSKYVASGSFYTQAQPHMALEPDVGSAFMDDKGVLNILCKAQYMEWIPLIISAGLGIGRDKIHVYENPTGGSFGYAMEPWNQALIGAVCIACNGDPVNMTLSYEEHMLCAGKRLPYYTNGTIACDENGKITATTFETIADKGAYSLISDSYLEKGIRFFGMPYYYPSALGWCGVVLSNSGPGIAYRGAGSPQLQTASETLIEQLAEKCGMDPLEFRYINVLADGDKHYNGHGFSVYPMKGILDTLRPMYEAAKKRKEEVQKTLPENIKRGVGVCCGCFNVTSGPNDVCTISMELRPDGDINVISNWPDVGQGGDIGSLVNAHEALMKAGLEIAPERLHLIMEDAALPSAHGPAAGSRSHYMDGMAMADGAKKLVAAMKKEDGTLRTYDEMVAEDIDTIYLGFGTTSGITAPINPLTGQGNPTAEYQFVAFLSEVDVDVKTGKVKVVSMHGVADNGVIGNYLAAEGQAYGGMSHTIGYGFTEDFSDVKKHTNIVGAGFPFIEDIPDGDDFTVTFNQSPRPSNPFGSTGLSEGFQSSDHMACLNAVHDATGAWIYSLPARPADVLAAIKCVEEGKEIPNPKYYFGSDFDERMDAFIAAAKAAE